MERERKESDQTGNSEELTSLRRAYANASNTDEDFFDKVQDEIFDFGKSAIKWFISDCVEPMIHDFQEATSDETGTTSIGLSGLLSPTMFIFNGIMMITIDNKGNVAYQNAYVGGVTVAAAPSASGSVFVTFTNAPTYDKLKS